MCILVSPALLLLACQQKYQRVPWPGHCPLCRPACLPSPSLPSVSVSMGVSAFISLRVLVTLWAYTCRNVLACVLTTASALTLFSVSRHGEAFTPARVSAYFLTGASTPTRVSASAIVLATTADSLSPCVSTSVLATVLASTFTGWRPTFKVVMRSSHPSNSR